MKILVVGTGSIGQRHVKNILSLGHSVGIFSYRGANLRDLNIASSDYEKDLYSAIESKKYQAVVVANKNIDHIPVAIHAAKHYKHLYIEKPLSNNLDKVDELKILCTQNNIKVETGFMMRLHPNIKFIKEFIDNKKIGEIINISLNVGYWLPFWRPGTNYQESYSAKTHEGGGVIFDLIHEIDLLRFLVGEISEVFAMTNKVGVLKIETEAIAEILARTDKNIISRINLNYVQPSYKREIEIIGTAGSVFWDYNTGNVEFFDKSSNESKIIHSCNKSFDRNDMFLEYMKFFIKNIDNLETVSSLSNGEQSLKLALAIHDSAKSKSLVIL